MKTPPPPVDIVLAIVRRIPEIGAEPGDTLVLRPTNRDFPATLRRYLPLASAMSFVNHPATQVIYVEPSPPVQPDDDSALDGPPAPRLLRLVR